MKKALSWFFLYISSNNVSGSSFVTQTTELIFLELQSYRLYFEADPALITEYSKQMQQS